MNYDQSWRLSASAKKDAEQPRWRLSGHAANSTMRAQWLDLIAHHTDGLEDGGMFVKVKTASGQIGWPSALDFEVVAK